MRTMWKSLTAAGALALWFRRSRNLLGVKRRLTRQLPGPYRRRVYKTWVLSHLGARREHARAANGGFTPLTIKISPTMRCNLSCVGCFAGSYPITGDMSFDTMTRIVQEAMALKIPSVGVIGGEPLLHPAVFDLFAQWPDVGFFLVTNGTRVTPDVIHRLKDMPNVITSFSVDGFQRTHDALRGEGVYVKILDAMARFKATGLAFGFSTTVHKRNLREVISEEYLDLMIGCGCLFGAFLPYIPVGSNPMYDTVCSEDEARDYYRKLDAIGATRPILILKEGYSDGTFLNSGCAAAHTMHITEKGEIEPCNGIEFATDTVHGTTLEGALMSEFFRDIRKLHVGSSRKCLVIAQPDAILEIVKRHRARPTHGEALEHMEHYAALMREDRGTDA